jgi:hypothetical protein
MVADQVAHPAHLNARDTALAFASRAPQERIARLKTRMGWELIPWYAITDDFDVDLGVDEWHVTNAFIRDDERIYRTYLVSSRGDEAMGSTWSYLDITALGRQEEWEDSPETRRPRRRGGGGSTTSSGRTPPRGSRDTTRPGPARQAGGWRVRGRAVIAHIGGLPVEETLMPLVNGAGAGSSSPAPGPYRSEVDLFCCELAARVAGIGRPLRLDQQDVCLFVCLGAVFDAARHDEQFALG